MTVLITPHGGTPLEGFLGKSDYNTVVLISYIGGSFINERIRGL